MNAAAHRMIFAIETLDSLNRLEAIWRDLEARADGSFFLSWRWIGCWLRETGLRPAIVVGRLDGRVVSLALLVTRRVWRRGWLHANTVFLHETGDPALDINFIEYNGILVDRSVGAAAIERCLAFLVATQNVDGTSAAWDELYLGGVPMHYAESLERF